MIAALALVLTGAAVISAVLILALRPLLQRYALAQPNARSSHAVPTPQGAGIAVIAATLVTSALSAIFAGAPPVPPLVFVATVLIAAVGALDDIRTIAPLPRLAWFALAVAIVVAALPAELRVLRMVPWWLERAVLILALLWFVNLVNFMDGLDWMTAAEMVPLLLGLVLLGLMGALPAAEMMLAAALAGALIGFAPFNRPVASVFLGDVGSLPIGLLAGYLLVELAGSGHLAAALLLPLYYLADATITLARRIVRRERFWEAHRSHFYQRATVNGLSVMQVVGRVLAVNVALAALATATVRIDSPAAGVAAVAIGAMLVSVLLWSFVRGRA